MPGESAVAPTAGLDHLLQAAAWGATALGAAFAAVQLWRQARQARASFLLELYRQWETLYDERVALHELRAACEDEVLRHFAKLSDRERQEVLKEVARGELTRMETDPARSDEYQKLLRLLGFFEHVGLMARCRYVRLADVDGLLRGPILMADALTRRHIGDLQARSGVPTGLYENFLFLADRTAGSG